MELALNLWIEEDDGGFWGSNWGSFFKVVIFAVAVVVMAFAGAWAYIVSGPFASAALVGALGYFFALGVAQYTGDAFLAKAILMSSALIGGTFGGLSNTMTTEMIGGQLVTNYGATMSFQSFTNLAMNMYLSLPVAIETLTFSTEEQYIEDMDSEDRYRAIMYGDEMDEMMYYNYEEDIAFKDAYSDYDRMT